MAGVQADPTCLEELNSSWTSQAILVEYLGDLVGYLSAPLAPDEAKHYRNQQAQIRISL
jgi:hypothetical protein